MLVHLKAIAQSFSEDTLNAAARELEESEVWKTSDKLRNWFQFNWLAHAKVNKYKILYFYILSILHPILDGICSILIGIALGCWLST